MPNWCYNNVFVSHESPEVLAGLVESFNKGGFCNHIAPMPQELRESGAPARDDIADANEKKYGYTDWYSFAVDVWGTKWDFGDEEGSLFENDDGTEAALTFDSAWGPPIKIYSKMEELGYKVDAFYYEPGCGFCGRWVQVFLGNDQNNNANRESSQQNVFVWLRQFLLRCHANS